MSDPAAAPCDNCGAEAPARYCPECGQETGWTPRRPAFRIAAEAVEEAFALDSRIGRTAAPFLARPGLLTAEYWAGRRVRYSSPLRLYLLTSFLFFLAGAARPMLQARTPPAAPEQASPEEQAEMGREAEALRRSGAMGAALAARVERIRSMPPREVQRRVSEAFEQNLARAAFLLVPLLALWCRLLWRQRYYAEHLVFALHAQSFGFAAMIPAALSGSEAAAGAGALGAAAWVALALRRLHGEGAARVAAKFLLLGLLYLATLGAVVGGVALLALLAL